MNRDRTLFRPVSDRHGTDGDAPWSGFGLPSELLASARKRLGGFVAFIGIALGVASVAMWFVPIDVSQFDEDFLKWTVIAQALLILLHLVFYALIRMPRFSHSLVLHLGFVYESILVFIIGAGTHWMNVTQGTDFDDRVFACLVIAVYPVIVPSPPWRTFWSSFFAAAMLPLSILALTPLGLPGTAEQYTTSVFLAVLSLAVAIFGARVIYGMNRDVARARRLGSYELETKLGQGGMGEVWRAKHRLLARPAAIKLIRPEMLGSSLAQAEVVMRRFEREAQATAGMYSPHTIELYDFGVSQDGTFYYVMELLEGMDLEELVERFGPLPAPRVVHLLRQACDSLGEAHEKGLTHRDIKPANIYACRYGRELDFVKVLDFGLVTGEVEGRSNDAGLTQENTVGGTPAFMAPEQALGKGPIDERTDIYALGCVAYWLLTGATVFDGASPMEVMMKHVRDVPMPASTRSELVVPAALDRLVSQCLEKEPERRPVGFDALAKELAESGLDQNWTHEDARRWWGRHLPAL